MRFIVPVIDSDSVRTLSYSYIPNVPTALPELPPYIVIIFARCKGR